MVGEVVFVIFQCNEAVVFGIHVHTVQYRVFFEGVLSCFVDIALQLSLIVRLFIRRRN